MRNFLTMKDLVRLSGCSRAEIVNWWKAGLIPAQHANPSGKHLRLVDSPELRIWCEVKKRRLSYEELFLEFLRAVVRAVSARDREADVPSRSDIVGEIFRQLLDSKNPGRLIKKWGQA